MPINIEIKIVPFGQVRFDISKPVPSVEESQAFPVREAVQYREPQKTASRIYEVQYGERPVNYIVPLFTG